MTAIATKPLTAAPVARCPNFNASTAELPRGYEMTDADVEFFLDELGGDLLGEVADAIGGTSAGTEARRVQGAVVLGTLARAFERLCEQVRRERADRMGL